MKIDKSKFLIVQDEYQEDIDLSDLDLPENQPRYIMISYKYDQDDGRVSYPLIFVYYSPSTVSMELKMMYAACRTYLVQKCSVSKLLELANAEDLCDKWIHDNLTKKL